MVQVYKIYSVSSGEYDRDGDYHVDFEFRDQDGDYGTLAYTKDEMAESNSMSDLTTCNGYMI